MRLNLLYSVSLAAVFSWAALPLSAGPLAVSGNVVNLEGAPTVKVEARTAKERGQGFSLGIDTATKILPYCITTRQVAADVKSIWVMLAPEEEAAGRCAEAKQATVEHGSDAAAVVAVKLPLLEVKGPARNEAELLARASALTAAMYIRQAGEPGRKEEFEAMLRKAILVHETSAGLQLKPEKFQKVQQDALTVIVRGKLSSGLPQTLPRVPTRPFEPLVRPRADFERMLRQGTGNTPNR